MSLNAVYALTCLIVATALGTWGVLRELRLYRRESRALPAPRRRR